MYGHAAVTDRISSNLYLERSLALNAHIFHERETDVPSVYLYTVYCPISLLLRLQLTCCSVVVALSNSWYLHLPTSYIDTVDIARVTYYLICNFPFISRILLVYIYCIAPLFAIAPRYLYNRSFSS